MSSRFLGQYILDGKHPKPSGGIEWAQWMEYADRKVKETYVGNVRISTVFLGLDHSFGGTIPILFETMIFGGEYDQYQDRYETWEEAEHGHELAVSIVMGELADENLYLEQCGICGPPPLLGRKLRMKAHGKDKDS